MTAMKERLGRTVLATTTLIVLIGTAQTFAQDRLKTGVAGGNTIFDAIPINEIKGNGIRNYDTTVPPGATLTSVEVKYGVGIDSFQITYEDAQGTVVKLPKIGGDGGDHTEVAVLGRKEILAGLRIKSGVRVDSITFIIKNVVTGKTREVFAGGKGGDKTMDLIPDEDGIGLYGDWDGHCIAHMGLVYQKTPKK
jgi:hypothetical protein